MFGLTHMNNKLINDEKKNIVYINRSTIPGSVSAGLDPDPHQNEVDPKHW